MKRRRHGAFDFLKEVAEDGKKYFQCKNCDWSTMNQGIERILKHLVRCKNLPEKERKWCNLSLSAYLEKSFAHKKFKTDPDNASSVSQGFSAVKPDINLPLRFTALEPSIEESNPREQRRQMVFAPSKIVSEGWTTKDKDLVQRKLALWAYLGAVSFNFFDIEETNKFFKHLVPWLEIPSRKTLTGSLLEEVYKDIHCQIDLVIVRDRVGPNLMLTLLTDGWTSVTGRHIMNFLVVTPTGETFFLYSFYSQKDVESAEAIAARVKACIELIGAKNINAIATDNASSMLSAAGIVAAEYTHIHSVGCVAHFFNLLVGDVLNYSTFRNTVSDAITLVKWFHSRPRMVVLEDKQMELYGAKRKLCMPIRTCWQSYNECLETLIDNQDAITRSVDQLESGRGKYVIQDEISSKVNDPSFWNGLRTLRKVILPILETLISFEDPKVRLSHVFGSVAKLMKQADSIEPRVLKDFVVDAIMRRWDNNIRSVPVLLSAFLDLSLPANEKPKFSNDFRELVSDWLNERYELTQRAEIKESLVDFARGTGKFWNFLEEYDKLKISDRRYEQTPARFWDVQVTGALAELAVSLLCIHPTTAPTERNWNTHKFMHSDLRHRLGPDKVSKLVYIYVNHRALEKANREKQLLGGSIEAADTDSPDDVDEEDRERGEDSEDDREDEEVYFRDLVDAFVDRGLDLEQNGESSGTTAEVCEKTAQVDGIIA